MAIRFGVDDGVATITLDRPRQRNAMNAEMLNELEKAVTETGNTDDIRVLRIAAEGPSFCAGSDLTELGSMTVEQMCDVEARKAALLRSLSLLTKPVVAAVQGYAVGGGAFLAAVCDVVVVAENAKLRCMEVPNGWITPWGIHALNARLSPRDAQRVSWGYEFLSAEDAIRIGLADHQASVENLEGYSAKIAEELAALPAIGVSATKEFFLERMLGPGEIEDARLNNLFRLHCSQGSAQETFKKFAK
ncbi:enoyl-CoA hydratase/isomerase family protein [Roseibium sp. SCP14]|uniref:enoyl-CoA hydratase/isomerase family protein n=1 Tax=Roseibium sp. SCP14 TaxID=3141375 RepID=UPI00333B15C7